MNEESNGGDEEGGKERHGLERTIKEKKQMKKERQKKTADGVWSEGVVVKKGKGLGSHYFFPSCPLSYHTTFSLYPYYSLIILFSFVLCGHLFSLSPMSILCSLTHTHAHTLSVSSSRL